MKRIKYHSGSVVNGTYVTSPTPLPSWHILGRAKDNGQNIIGNEFNADPITTNNWEGGVVCNHVRKSKSQIWAFKMLLSEGFTITITGKKIKGNPGNWLIINGTQKYILTERMFRKKLRRIT